MDQQNKNGGIVTSSPANNSANNQASGQAAGKGPVVSMIRQGGQAQMMGNQIPDSSQNVGQSINNGEQMLGSRKQKFMNQQQSGTPGSKHKVTMSADQQNLLNQSGQQPASKHISMNGLPYDKMKGLTPVGKQNSGSAPKHGHMQGSFEEGNDFGQPRQNHSNSRNNNSRMPTLPSSIKGSIGGQAGPNTLQLGGAQASSKRQMHPGMPLNIAANDITFSNAGYNQIRKFGGQGNGVSGNGPLASGQNINLNNQKMPQNQHNFVMQGGGQSGKQPNLNQILKQQAYGVAGIDRNSNVSHMRMQPDAKYINQQAMQQKRAKAHSGLGHFNNQTLLGGSGGASPMNQPNSTTNQDKNKMRQTRVRSQLGQHQPMPLDQINIVQQSSSQQKHQNMPLNQQVLNNFMNNQVRQRQDSRKSNGASSAAGGRRRMVESPEMFRNVGNQSLSQQSKIYGANGGGKQGTPLRQGQMKKQLIGSRPASAQSKGQNTKVMAGLNAVQPQSSSNKTGQSLQGLGIHGLGQGQGLQGVQTTSQKLRQQQQLANQQQEGGAENSRNENTQAQESSSTQQPAQKSNKISNVVTKFSFATKGGIAAHNPYKTNQDAYITSPHIMGLKHCHFFSVCDGHGQNGREVSGLLKHRLPFHVEAFMKKNLGTHDFTKEYPPSALVYQSLKEAFDLSQQEVCQMQQDTRYSGSTCVSVMTLGRKIYVANVGDSRGITIRALPTPTEEKQAEEFKRNPALQCGCTALSRDHKPDDKDEADRIIANGGRIDSYRDQHNNPLGPLRVWLKHEDVPGLAMTRSFGDAVAHSVGCNADPEMNEYTFTKDDKVVVIASDGVWEFLENIDVARIVYPFYLQKNAEGAAENLVRASFKRWRKEESVIDDITCIVIFLDVK